MPSREKIIQLFSELEGQDTEEIKTQVIEEKLDEKLVLEDNINHPSFTKYYVIKKLVELFLNSEEGEKAQGRKIILNLCKKLIYFILFFEVLIILLQGLKIIHLDNIIFIGTIGTITSGIVFLLKSITKSLYNDESDKVLKTVEAIINKL